MTIEQEKFLQILFHFLVGKTKTSLRICELITSREKGVYRDQLRLCWNMLDVGKPNLSNVQKVLVSLEGTIFGEGSTGFRLHKSHKIRGRLYDPDITGYNWTIFSQDGSPIDLLKALKVVVTKPMRISSIWLAICMEDSGRTLQIANDYLLSQDVEGMTEKRLLAFMELYQHRNVDGYVLARGPNRCWAFVKR